MRISWRTRTVPGFRGWAANEATGQLAQGSARSHTSRWQGVPRTTPEAPKVNSAKAFDHSSEASGPKIRMGSARASTMAELFACSAASALRSARTSWGPESARRRPPYMRAPDSGSISMGTSAPARPLAELILSAAGTAPAGAMLATPI